MKILKIEEETYEKLSEIRKGIGGEAGKLQTYDQVINKLIDFWKKGVHATTTTTTSTVTSKSDQPPPGTMDPYYSNR